MDAASYYQLSVAILALTAAIECVFGVALCFGGDA